MKKILLLLGTRPEAIKMAPVYLALRKADDCFQTKLCLTGQHRELAEEVLRFFHIKPDYRLEVMEESQGDLTQLTAHLLAKIQFVLDDFRPDLVLVQGDTTSAFAGGLAAFYAGIPVGHVEAGLRTFDQQNPFPEEFNRVALSRLADFHFAPTETARQNLLKENIPADRIIVTGNTVVDALLMAKATLADASPLLDTDDRKLLLVTLHRRENQGENFHAICKALLALSETEDWLFAFPVHPNPVIRETAHRLLQQRPNILLMEPLGYGDFIPLMLQCNLILTDSGGIQEEATVLGKPVLLVRKVTERPEAVEAGWVHVVGTDGGEIVRQARAAMERVGEVPGSLPVAVYGDGRAAERIVDFLKQFLKQTKGALYPGSSDRY